MPDEHPSLGPLVATWGEAHCVIPDRDVRGEAFVLYGDQLDFVDAFYRVKPRAQPGQLAPAFVYRRAQLVLPQKAGKGPLTAFMVCCEAVGPVLFAGWAEGGEVYDCRDYRCGCGFVYTYEPGEPIGRPWPTPLIQITATSEEQTDNVYDALRPMIDLGPLHELIPKTGEQFIRLPNAGRIDTVTSNARSRLGQRVTFVPWDESGLYTQASGMLKVADTQGRGLAGMGGRGLETTNAWDPSEASTAQQTFESNAKDILRVFPQAPPGLSFGNKVERRRILRHVYGGSVRRKVAGQWVGHVDLDSIEAEAAALLERDPAQAERFFGNRIVHGLGAWLPEGLWANALAAS
jgi:hypothetical protein